MKKNKVIIVSTIISIILLMFPTQVFAWLPKTTYEACNKINIYISIIMIVMAIIIFISYITAAIAYIRHSKTGTKQKLKNIFKWLGITIAQVLILLFEAILANRLGMELYWYPTGERYQFDPNDGFISNTIRIVALLLIIVYIITAIIYFIKSKKEQKDKLMKLVKWQMVVIIIFTVLLLLAKNW